LKPYKHNDTVFNAAGNFSQNRHASPLPAALMQSVSQQHNVNQLVEHANKCRNDKTLESAKCHPGIYLPNLLLLIYIFKINVL
jgi:hypothetical protein